MDFPELFSIYRRDVTGHVVEIVVSRCGTLVSSLHNVYKTSLLEVRLDVNFSVRIQAQ